MSNEKDVLAARNLHEGSVQEAIHNTKGTSKKSIPGAPFLFSLDQLTGLPGYDTLNESSQKAHPLKEICTSYQAGHTKYIMDQLPEFTAKLSTDVLQDVADSIAETGTPPKSFMDALALVGSQNDTAIKKRDEAIWTLMKSHPELKIKGNMGKYVMYDPRLSGFREEGDESGKMHCGISLNEAGVHYLNSEIERTKGKKDSLHQVIFSKYYRKWIKTNVVSTEDGGTTKEYIMHQKALPIPFAQVSNSKLTVETMCTDGYDKKGLLDHYPIQGALDMNPPDLIKPSDHLVTYDQDTGVCKYDTSNSKWSTQGYCAYMGGTELSSEAETKTFHCEGKGCDMNTYQVCKPLDGVEGVLAEGFGLIEADWIVTDGRRSINALESWVDPEGKHRDLEGAGIGIAGGAAAGALVGLMGGPLAPISVPFGAGVGAIIGGIGGFLA